jgi:5'(3')-deoxyribonucleotidase
MNYIFVNKRTNHVFEETRQEFKEKFALSPHSLLYCGSKYLNREWILIKDNHNGN